MKTSTCKYFLLVGLFLLLIACSTKKNSFVNRNFHAVNTEYNVLYNGNIALDAGLNDLKTTYVDNYWDVLSIERMQPTVAEMGPTDKKNANFERAETKATKAIQKHSMNIAGSEKNPQMDEAHLLLGKARYYDNRFIPSLEAFNYILYKYPNSSRIDEAKVWREKTNIRLGNENIAIRNLKELLTKKKELMDEEIYSGANAMLAQGYLNIGAADSAVYVLKRATEYTRDNEKKARYHFITGQLYNKLKYKDSAYAEFQKVIDMKRKSPRIYTIQAHAMQAWQFDFEKGDTLAFMEKYRKLLKDRANRPFLDVLHHQVALSYDKQKMDDKAIEYYNKSLRRNSKDKYLVASNYRNVADIYFKEARYVNAGKYYDSTLVNLLPRTREYTSIKKKRDNLNDVIKYEGIAQTNDSILHVVGLNDEGRIAYYNDYIAKLKIQDENERKRLEAEAIRRENMAGSGNMGTGNDMFGTDSGSPVRSAKSANLSATVPFDRKAMMSKDSGNAGLGAGTSGTGATSGGKFYFYNVSAVGYGKQEFKKNWGDRPLVDNWRWSSDLKKSNALQSGDSADSLNVGDKKEKTEPRYMPEFYISQIPTDKKLLDSLAKDRNFAYFQLGSIYKDKFKEYQRAADKLERLLQNQPEERLVLPAMYNLYKIYEIIDPAKALVYKERVLKEYPESRYAEIIRNPMSEEVQKGSPDAVYATLYKQYQAGDIRGVAAQIDEQIDVFTGEPIVAKLEMLKARVEGRLKGIEAYKKGLNYVALNFPDNEEGKVAEAMLKTDIPNLEKLTFGEKSVTYKAVFKVSPNDAKNKLLKEKIQKFIKEGLNNNITLSEDIYTESENFIVIHGFINRLAAVDAVSILKDYKAYKIAETPVIMPSEDYKVVQIKKNFDQYTPIK